MRARWTGLCFISSQNKRSRPRRGHSWMCPVPRKCVSVEGYSFKINIYDLLNNFCGQWNETAVSLNMNGTIWDNTRSEIPRRLFIRPLPPSSFIVVRLKQNPSHFLKTPDLASAEAHFLRLRAPRLAWFFVLFYFVFVLLVLPGLTCYITVSTLFTRVSFHISSSAVIRCYNIELYPHSTVQTRRISWSQSRKTLAARMWGCYYYVVLLN